MLQIFNEVKTQEVWTHNESPLTELQPATIYHQYYQHGLSVPLF